MDQNTTTQTGAPMPEEKSSMSAIISIIVIVLVLAGGAFYFFKQVPVPEVMSDLNAPAALQADTTLTGLGTQGTSTDLADIEADLNATNLSGVDAGLSDIAI